MSVGKISAVCAPSSGLSIEAEKTPEKIYNESERDVGEWARDKNRRDGLFGMHPL